MGDLNLNTQDEQNTVDKEYVASAIAKRYAHPGRTAYLYLFRMKPGTDFDPLVPAASSVVSAWMDEGKGLEPTSIEMAIQRCKANHEAKLKYTRPLDAQGRRAQMARSVLFSVVQPDNENIQVRLVSRALAYSPKGDREANELWQRTGDGWYSSYRGHAE